MICCNFKWRSRITAATLKPKAPFKWVFIIIILSTSPKPLTSENTFYKSILTVYAYSKTPKLYGMVKITTEEVMYDLDMFQSRFGKIDKFRWWDLEIFSADAGKKFTSAEFK